MPVDVTVPVMCACLVSGGRWCSRGRRVCARCRCGGFVVVVAVDGVGQAVVGELAVVFAAQGDGVGQVGFACAGVEELSVG